MASPGEMVKTIAAALGMPEATVVVHDRNLVVAGLRTKGGRGRSAAKVTARDAANLLTAVMGAGQIKDSVLVIQRYEATRIHESTSPHEAWTDFIVPEMAALPPDHSFLDGLEALIQAAANGSLAKGLYEGAAEIEGKKLPYILPPVHVAVQTPNAIGDIRIRMAMKGMARSVRYAIPFPEEGTFEEISQKYNEILAKYHSDTDSDMKQFREVTSSTIFEIAKALKS